MLLSGFPRRVGAEDLARRNFGLLVSAARCCSTGSGRLLRAPRFNLLCHPYAREGQAVVCPLLRGRSPTRSVAPKPLRGLGRASLRLPWARGCRRNLARRNFGLLVSAPRCGSRRSGRLGGAAARSYDLLVSAAPLYSPLSPLRARGPGRGRPAATGSLANAIGRAKTAPGSRACFSPAFRARAWCRRIWRGVVSGKQGDC